MGLLAVLNEVRGAKLSAKLRNAMAMYDLTKTSPALLSTDWANADDSRNYLTFFSAGESRTPPPSRSGIAPSQGRGDKGADSGDARERNDGRLYPPLPRSSCRAETRPAGRGFRARDGLLAICAAFPSSGWQIRAPRSSTP